VIEWGQGESPGGLTLRTPAKVNFGLRLVGQRADGYHLLESVFAPIDLYDEIELAWHAGPDEIQFSL
jgi:4-diphosphocytidyl-2C-methyl-D-erythritol kinase